MVLSLKPKRQKNTQNIFHHSNFKTIRAIVANEQVVWLLPYYFSDVACFHNKLYNFLYKFIKLIRRFIVAIEEISPFETIDCI